MIVPGLSLTPTATTTTPRGAQRPRATRRPQPTDDATTTARTTPRDHAIEVSGGSSSCRLTTVPLTSATADGAADHHAAGVEPSSSASHGHGHSDESASSSATTATDAAGTADVPAWPRPWDPTSPIDFSGVPGVDPWSNRPAPNNSPPIPCVTCRRSPTSPPLAALGYRSIGDSSTGFEHYVNGGYIADDKFLDPAAPESLVYEVDGDDRTLVSAMFIAKRHGPSTIPALVEVGGPLMQWHVHLTPVLGARRQRSGRGEIGTG